MKKSVFALITLYLLSIHTGQLRAAGSITGHARFEKIKGRPNMGYQELYEWDLFCSPEDNSITGPFARLGAPAGQVPTGDGYYKFDNLPAGTYSLYINQPDFLASPKVIPNVIVEDNKEKTLNIDLDIDYSTYFREGEQWTDWGPWDWYQTFRATGTSVRGVSFVLAGWNLYNGKTAVIKILEDNGDGDVRNWKQIGYGEDRQIGSEEWVRWNSGEIPITPGRQYAVNIHIDGGLAIYKRNKDGNSYEHGRAYDGDGNAKNFDLNITVFVDRNNQMVTHTRRFPKPGDLASGGAARWGQTFVATGTSLAAVDLFQANGTEPTFPIKWIIRKNGPNGSQVGPTKTVNGAYFASNADLSGASYNPEQVPLVPGQIYYIEASNPNGASFTAYVQEDWNRYDDGQAYRNGEAIDEDLAMTIVEYSFAPPPQGLTALWRLDETSGQTAYDAGANKHDATFSGNPVWQPDGKFGGSLRFDGGDYLAAENFKGITGSQQRTCAAWIKMDPAETSCEIFCWGANQPGQLWRVLVQNINGKGVLRTMVNGGYVYGSIPVNTGEWTHIAVILPENGTNTTDIRLYVNGIRETEGGLTVGPFDINTASSDDVRIGSNGTRFHIGSFDDVAIFDIALTDSQIAQLIAAGANSFALPCGEISSPPRLNIPGDINKDCIVNLLDLSLLSGSWLGTGILPGDIAGESTVNIEDLLLLSEDWLKEPGKHARWTFDESEGMVAFDESGNNRHAAMVNMEAEDRIDGAIELDGVEEYLVATEYKGVGGSASRTCSAWIKTTKTNADILWWGDTSEDGSLWNMKINGAGKLRVQVNGGAINGTIPINNGRWTHVAAVLPNGKSSTEDIILYVNGLAEQRDVVTVAPQQINTSVTTDVLIGTNITRYFQGMLDDVRIYSRPLTSEEIRRLLQ